MDTIPIIVMPLKDWDARQARRCPGTQGST